MRTINERVSEIGKKLTAANIRADQAEQDRNYWHDKAQEYRQQRDELQSAFTSVRDHRDQLDDQLYGLALPLRVVTGMDALPRVITADELRRGQKIAVFNEDESSIGVVASSSKYSIDFTNYGGWSVSPEEMPTLVLLADAPDTKDINVAKETVKGEYPDNPWFATVYEDTPYLAGTWRGTPVRPQSIRTGDLYDIHTAHGSRITGVVAARNGVRNPQNGDQYRIIQRAGSKA